MTNETIIQNKPSGKTWKRKTAKEQRKQRLAEGYITKELFHLAESIEKLRVERGWKEYQLAQMIRIINSKNSGEKSKEEPKEDSDYRTIYNWERGNFKTFSVNALIDLCKVFNLSADYFLGTVPEDTHDIHYIAEYTGLSEDAIKILHDCNTNAYRYIAETIELLLKYEDSKRVAGETAKRPLLAIRRFFYCINNKLQWFPNTGRISNDGINTIFDDDLYVEDAALLHINRILNDMKKEWHNPKNQNTPHAPQ